MTPCILDNVLYVCVCIRLTYNVGPYVMNFKVLYACSTCHPTRTC